MEQFEVWYKLDPQNDNDFTQRFFDSKEEAISFGEALPKGTSWDWGVKGAWL